MEENIKKQQTTPKSPRTEPIDKKKILRAEEAYKVMLGHFLLYGRYPSTIQLGKLMSVSTQRAQVYINDLARMGMIKFSNDGYKLGYDYRALLVKHTNTIKQAWYKDKYGSDVIR